MRQFLLSWKLTSNESKRQQEIEKKASLVRQRIQERIQKVKYLRKARAHSTPIALLLGIHLDKEQETQESERVNSGPFKCQSRGARRKQ